MKVIFEATEDLTALVRDAKKAIKEMGFTKKRAINKNTIQKIINEELSFIKVKLYDRLKNKLENVILFHYSVTLPLSRLSPQDNSSFH
jgi:predicted RNA-binding protein